MITNNTIGGNLKRKYIGTVKERKAAFEKEHGREPATDSEIDDVYGAGSATEAMDKVYRKMKKK